MHDSGVAIAIQDCEQQLKIFKFVITVIRKFDMNDIICYDK